MSNPHVVTVLGLHRSGSSCIAGVLSRLGVFFGRRRDFVGREPDGGYEHRDLAKLCEWWLPFPGTEFDPAKSIDTCRARFRAYAEKLARMAPWPPVGSKYPTSIMLFEPFIVPHYGYHKHVVLVCRRPLGESIDSLVRLGVPKDAAERVQTMLRSQLVYLIERYSKLMPFIALEYRHLLEAPGLAIRDLVGRLGLEHNEQRIATATKYVDPEMRHIGGGWVRT